MADGSTTFEQPSEPTLRQTAALYRQHHGFVWRVLRRFGVPDHELDDAVQETFLVVVRRLHDFDGRAAITTWLYAVAVRVASTLRRSDRRERARRIAAGADVHGLGPLDPEAELSRAEAARILDALLDELDDPKRTVFVLAELEGVRVPEISRILGVNVRTVHSRLRLARERFGAALHRHHAREAGSMRRAGLRARRLASLAAGDRPPVPRRKAAAAALVARVESGAVPVLAGWKTLALATPASSALPLVTALALGGIGALTVSAAVSSPEQRDAATPGGLRASEPAVVPRHRAADGDAAEPTAPASPPETTRRAAAASEPAAAAPGDEPRHDASPGRARHRDATPTGSAVGSPEREPAPRTDAAAALAAETELIESVRTALRDGDATRALARLDRHAAAFPDGVLAPEARSSRLRALCLAGREAEAHALADRLGGSGTDSRWHAVVAAACQPRP